MRRQWGVQVYRVEIRVVKRRAVKRGTEQDGVEGDILGGTDPISVVWCVVVTQQHYTS